MDFDELRRSGAAVVSIADAASLLSVDVRTVSRAMHNGDLPVLRVGRRLLIPRLPFLATLGVPVDGSETTAETRVPVPKVS